MTDYKLVPVELIEQFREVNPNNYGHDDVWALEGAFCTWRNDPETDNAWDTGCRQLFELYDGTPSENRMSFCCYCGKPIQEDIDRARRDEGEGE